MVVGYVFYGSVIMLVLVMVNGVNCFMLDSVRDSVGGWVFSWWLWGFGVCGVGVGGVVCRGGRWGFRVKRWWGGEEGEVGGGIVRGLLRWEIIFV